MKYKMRYASEQPLILFLLLISGCW